MPFPDGLHTPLTNGPAEAAPAQKLFDEPNLGDDPQNIQPSKDGHEEVPRPEAAAAREGEEILHVPDTGHLSDIGEASFGRRILAETVHGTDNRAQITDTTMYPWRATASLLITARDGSQWLGTAWFIGPRTLATAGHCVCIKNSGVEGRDGWVRSIQAIPGRKQTAAPFGAVTSSVFWSVKGWVESGDENYDYAAIILPKDLGNQTGWFGLAVLEDNDLKQAIGNIGGYPADKSAGTFWYDQHKIGDVSPTKVIYDIDSFGGQSGAAVYLFRDGKRYGVAVHAYGGPLTNSGTRISVPVLQNFRNWKAV